MKGKDLLKKRLFLFAGYDKSGVVDDALVFYVRALSEFGDVVVCMDSDCEKSELKKIQKYCVTTVAVRHGEYDFGSYKRDYLWACENLDLKKYDFLYLVNDSVYGPLYDLGDYFNKMESLNVDAFGIVKNPHRNHPHIQSWFVGLKPSVFCADRFDKFMRRITKLKSKGLITREYEQGLTQLVEQQNLKWECLYSEPGRGVYNNIKSLYNRKMPFMKKVAFIRNHGALGREVRYVLDNVDYNLKNAILASAERVYGAEYVRWFLDVNPVKVMCRKLKHVMYKLFIEGI